MHDVRRPFSPCTSWCFERGRQAGKLVPDWISGAKNAAATGRNWVAVGILHGRCTPVPERWKNAGRIFLKISRDKFSEISYIAILGNLGPVRTRDFLYPKPLIRKSAVYSLVACLGRGRAIPKCRAGEIKLQDRTRSTICRRVWSPIPRLQQIEITKLKTFVLWKLPLLGEATGVSQSVSHRELGSPYLSLAPSRTIQLPSSSLNFFYFTVQPYKPSPCGLWERWRRASALVNPTEALGSIHTSDELPLGEFCLFVCWGLSFLEVHEPPQWG